MVQGSDGRLDAAASTSVVSGEDPRNGFSAFIEQVGADFQQYVPQYRQIFQKAEIEGYSLELLSWECGVVQFRRGRQVLMRLNLGEENLRPGKWESKAATVLAQLQISQLMQQSRTIFADLQDSKAYAITALEKEFSSQHREFGAKLCEILALEPEKLALRLNRFPGAEQLQLLHQDEQIASLIQNPTLGMVLEFRLSYLAVTELQPVSDGDQILPELLPDQLLALEECYREEFEVLGVIPEKIAAVRSEIRQYSFPLEPALIELAQDKSLLVLGIGDTHLGFGDPNRRLGMRLLRRLRACGFSHFAVPAPRRENERIQSSLADGTFRRVWLEIAARASVTRMSAEWTSLIQRAYDVGMQVVAVGCTSPDEHGSVAAGVLDCLLVQPDAKILLWLENAELGRGIQANGRCTVGELLYRSLGAKRFCSIASITHQMSGNTLKYFTEGPEPEFSLEQSVLLRVARARIIASMPFSINNQNRYSGWDYLAIYPGLDTAYIP